MATDPRGPRLAPTTAERYATFAAREARGVSPTYERLAAAVATHNRLLDLLDTLPAPRRWTAPIPRTWPG